MNARRLLIIDEARDEAKALAKTLARDGYTTRRVSDAPEAMRHLGGAHPPDLVLWSASPNRHFTHALNELKARGEPGFLPVVLLSQRATVDERVAGLRAGADDVMAKPWRADEIRARVAALLRIRSSHEALAHAKLELERQSITDPLTGLFNRRYFQYRLQQEIERGRRYGESVSLLVLDIDHFKNVNDRYGHRAGDEALLTLSGLMAQEVRRMDVCTRWGGEEFAVIMPNTSAAGALVVARRLLRSIRTRASFDAIPLSEAGAGPESVAITASLGLCSFPSAGVDSADALVQQADAAMYRAKEEGRNRICTTSEPPHSDQRSSSLRVLRTPPPSLTSVAHSA